ncbi:Ribosomal lysine N-methyltransferase 4 [Ascochyta rabiei]|uniref:Uncharacterized protein n=1 Tax=Didymella rabiei TaxID=5454 RepID=A0A163KMB7_DIDRA|nr:Ribosomal lysine N-methyltransferase 4 [Ascochyta rabiei]KZM27101.1 hypothetical protein ST47_g1753 [Ascochyta rabiei]UPX12326.1 Ribosomal lysine N-methyltransferase 4 [Ascochyta rabiei]
MADFDGIGRAFLTWLQQSGAELSPKIKLDDLRHAQAGRGVVATQDIAEHELLFRIPRSAILSVENSILSSEIPNATFDTLGPWLSLILVMLYEYFNGDVSNWAAYFAVLPSEFDTLMYWTEDELAELQASAVRDKVGKESANRMFLDQLIPVIKEFASLFFADDERAPQRAEEMRDERNLTLMHRMGSLIMAYAFDVEPSVSRKDIDEEGYVSEDEDEALPKGMVPLADMLNAEADRNNARLFYEANSLDMKAFKPIRAGEEIYNDYGPLPRSDLLRRYGYITENYAQYDVVEISMDLVTDLATAAGIYSEARIDYLDEQGVIDTGYDLTSSNPFALQECLSPGLVVLAETLLLPGEEFDRMKKKGKLLKPDKMTSNGAGFLRRLIQARLAQYVTSFDDDVRNHTEVPSVGGHGSKERRFAMARAVRIGEKRLLMQVEEALTEKLAGGASKRPREVDEEGDVEMGGTGKRQRA